MKKRTKLKGGEIVRSRTLVRILPKLGLCSRAEAYGLIRSGLVTVNGLKATDPNRIASPADRIYVDGNKAEAKRRRYILFHKPSGCVTTRKDELGRRTVYDILGDVGARVFPVGRLDKDSEGLLIFTNDTAFGDFLTDPANKIPRAYVVTVDGALSERDIVKISSGVDIGRGECSRPVSVRILERGGDTTKLEMTLVEGKNREIRRLCEALGTTVTRLVRVSFGPFRLDNLPIGKWRELECGICVDMCRRG